MSDIINGQCEAVSIKGTRGSVSVGGQWYGAYNAAASDVSEDLKGKKIQFTFYESKGYKNIKGKVRVTAEPGGVSSAEGSGTSAASDGKKYYKQGFFPIDAEDGQRSFIRKDSLSLALEVVRMADTEGVDVPLAMIEIARQFEAFITGDLDREEVDAAIEAMKKTKGK